MDGPAYLIATGQASMCHPRESEDPAVEHDEDGKDRRGDETPAEWATKEGRLKWLKEAKALLRKLP